MVARLQFVVDNPCYESFSTPSANYRRSRMAKLEIELKSPSFSNTKMVPMYGITKMVPDPLQGSVLNLQKPVSFHVLSPLALLSPQFTPHSAASLSLLPTP